MFRPFVIAGLLVSSIAAVPVLADSTAIGQRKQLLKDIGAAARDPGKMLRGEEPFDLAKVQASLKTIADHAAKLPDLFPEDSKTGDTKALPVIWNEKEKFSAIFVKLAKDATEAQPAIKDEATFKTEIPKVFGNCGGCHKVYRGK
jgi:cytochrome c556